MRDFFQCQSAIHFHFTDDSKEFHCCILFYVGFLTCLNHDVMLFQCLLCFYTTMSSTIPMTPFSSFEGLPDILIFFLIFSLRMWYWNEILTSSCCTSFLSVWLCCTILRSLGASAAPKCVFIWQSLVSWEKCYFWEYFNLAPTTCHFR